VPDQNFMWAFYGSLSIENPGTYTLCLASHDGSVLSLDNQLIISDVGQHGVERRCGSTALAAGNHEVSVEGFTSDTAATVVVTYSGPDTGGGELQMPSKGKITSLPDYPAPQSRWGLSLYSSATFLSCLPDFSVLEFVGKAEISIINFNSRDDFLKAISKTPNENYAWSFDGSIMIRNSGVYSFCTSSDDGSYIYLDGELIADNSGLHGMVQKCGKRNIGAGSHSFKVTGFQGGGGVGQHVRYSGPDTGGVTRWLRSTKANYNAHGEPTKFSMCIFQAGYALSSVPWLGSLAYVGVGQMSVVNLNSAEDFRQVVSNTPWYNFVWGIYGKLRVEIGGDYTLCITSDDGSREYVGGQLLVNDDGLHGMVKQCGTRSFVKGDHLIYIEGFNSGGGTGMIATYSGPDTNGFALMKSGVACAPTAPGCS